MRIGAATTALVFQYSFAGTTYTVAMEAGAGGWTLIAQSAAGADDVEINAALGFVSGLGGGEVVLLRATFVIVDPIDFPGNNLTLSGMGRATFIDGDALATTEHGIVISGRDDCVVRDLAIQTEDGGGKTCHCIFIEDGSDRFHIETVWIVESDTDGIHIEGTNINQGYIINCNILGSDGSGIIETMDAANTLTGLRATNCYITGCVDGVNLSSSLNAVVSTVIATACTNYGIVAGDRTRRLDIVSCITYVNTFSGIALGDDIYDINIIGCICYDNTNHGIEITVDDEAHDINIEGCFLQENDNSGIYVSGHADINIVSNYMVANGEHGIFLLGVYFGAVSDNFIRGNGTTVGDWHGLYLNESNNIKITSNYLTENDLDGIHLVGDSDDNFITDNYLRQNGRYGINVSVATCNDNWVRDNYLLGNTTGPFNDAGTDTRLATVPITLIQGTTFISTAGEAWGWRINADTNFALGIGWLPLEVQQVVRIRVIGVALAAPGAGDYMRIQITGEGATFDEVFTTEPIDVVDHNNEEVNVAIDDVVNWVFDATDDADIGHLLGGDRLQIKVLHEGAGNGDAETNAIVDSIQAEYV